MWGGVRRSGVCLFNLGESGTKGIATRSKDEERSPRFKYPVLENEEGSGCGMGTDVLGWPGQTWNRN